MTYPPGFYWEPPGFPSLAVPYGKTSDFFFSGAVLLIYIKQTRFFLMFWGIFQVMLVSWAFVPMNGICWKCIKWWDLRFVLIFTWFLFYWALEHIILSVISLISLLKMKEIRYYNRAYCCPLALFLGWKIRTLWKRLHQKSLWKGSQSRKQTEK